MLDEYLKIFDLDEDFSINELDERYEKLLKEFDTENIEDDLKFIFLDEQEKIREAYHMLSDKHQIVDYVEDSVSTIIPVRENKNKSIYYIIGIPISILLLSSIIFFFLIINEEGLSIPKIENIDDYEIIKNHDPEWDYIRMYDNSYRVRKKSDPYDVWNEPREGKELEAVKKVFESAEEKKPCECGCNNENIIENE